MPVPWCSPSSFPPAIDRRSLLHGAHSQAPATSHAPTSPSECVDAHVSSFHGLLGLRWRDLTLGAFAQSVVTDKPTYDHGETAIITAVGFRANEPVTFTITCPTCITPSLEQPWTAPADTEGEIVTTWIVSPAAPFGSEFEVSVNGSSSGQASFLFSNALGAGRVASVTPVAGGCVEKALPPVAGPELWYVEEYESYRVRLTNVTDVGAGGTAASIQVIVNSQNTAS